MKITIVTCYDDAAAESSTVILPPCTNTHYMCDILTSKPDVVDFVTKHFTVWKCNLFWRSVCFLLCWADVDQLLIYWLYHWLFWSSMSRLLFSANWRTKQNSVTDLQFLTIFRHFRGQTTNQWIDRIISSPHWSVEALSVFPWTASLSCSTSVFVINK